MARDALANIVDRLRERGFDPRKVAHDAWESRCPAHRSMDHALSITRNEHNHDVLECRGTEDCHHTSIVRALAFTNDHLYAETPEWLIGRLRRVEVRPSSFTKHGAQEINVPPPEEGPELTREQPEIAGDIDATASSPDGETPQAMALCSVTAAAPAVAESPSDALMRMAGVERVILGSDGRSYALVAVNGHFECRELKSKAFRHLLTHVSLKATGKLAAPEAIAAVVSVLEANAEIGGEHADVFLRVRARPFRVVLFPESSARFVTIAMTEEKDTSATDDGSPLIGERVRAYIEERNRAGRQSD